MKNWIVMAGHPVDTTQGGGFEYFGPFTEAEAEQVRQQMVRQRTKQEVGSFLVLAVQLLSVRCDQAETSTEAAITERARVLRDDLLHIVSVKGGISVDVLNRFFDCCRTALSDAQRQGFEQGREAAAQKVIDWWGETRSEPCVDEIRALTPGEKSTFRLLPHSPRRRSPGET